MCLYRIPLVLPESRIAHAGFIDLGSDSLPCVAREFPIKDGADGTLANSVSEPSLYLAEVQTSWACGRVAPEVPGTGALNPPGESGDSICWESVRHGTSSEELPA